MQNIISDSKKHLRTSCRNTGKYIKTLPPETGIIITVIGVLSLAASFLFNVSTNYLLFAGLLLIVVGIVAYTNGVRNNS